MSVNSAIQLIHTVKPFYYSRVMFDHRFNFRNRFFFSTFMSIRMNLLFLISLPGHSLLNYLKDALWNFSNCLHIKCKINLWWIMQFDWTTLFPGLKNSSQKECVIMAELTGRESKKKTPDLCLHYIWLTKVQVPDYSKGLSLSHF